MSGSAQQVQRAEHAEASLTLLTNEDTSLEFAVSSYKLDAALTVGLAHYKPSQGKKGLICRTISENLPCSLETHIPGRAPSGTPAELAGLV